MPLYRAEWLLPISQPPIRDAWLQTERGRIVAFGHSHPGDLVPSNEIDLGRVAVLPGIVNAHTHLELSWMRGRIPITDDFPSWIRAVLSLMKADRKVGTPSTNYIANAIVEARAFGTAVIGDISNTLLSPAILIELNMPAVVFHELIGFQGGAAQTIVEEARSRVERLPRSAFLRYSLGAHAPYSVSPALFRAIAAALENNPSARSSVHLGESEAELEFLSSGTGPWRTLLEDLDVWDRSWVPPRCDPVEFLDSLGFIDDRLLVVHGVHFSEPAVKRLAAKGATLVTCPRGNLRTGAGVPPIADFYQSGARVAVGTDSLASVPDLNVFAELAELRRLAPQVRASALLESATINGACALGFERQLGTIDPGKRDALLAIEVEEGVVDIEEHLVSGIDVSQIRWLPES